MVRDFQTIVGLETKEQLKEAEGRDYPDHILACVGGGSNSIGIYNPYLDDDRVNLVGVEAGGKGVEKSGDHATRLNKKPKVGVVEGYKSFFLQNQDGQVEPTHSISAGLDYAGIGPQHAHLFEQGRVKYKHATDKQVLEAFTFLAKTEGLLGALESLHGFAYAMELAPTLSPDKIIVVNLSGRAEKDIFILGDKLGDKGWNDFLEKKAKGDL
jgi:tryptophan synthase beta chain